MKLRLSRSHFPVTVLGHGRRIGLWVQGCSIGCAGCVSRDTWDADTGVLAEIEDVLAWCARYIDEADGVTISGGEPFEQPGALLALLDGLHALRRERGREADLLCYSGLPWSRLIDRHQPILERLDAVIPEPFAERRPTDARWRGSANQSIRPLTALGRARYADVDAAPDGPRMQMTVKDGQLWMIGIPRRRELDRLLEACRARGVEAEEPSWIS